MRPQRMAIAFVSGLALALIVAVVSPALNTSCSSTNGDGTRNCSGTDVFAFTGIPASPGGCPPAGLSVDAYADEVIPADATEIAHTFTASQPACGNIVERGTEILPGAAGMQIYRVRYRVHGTGEEAQNPVVTIAMSFKRPAASGTDTTTTTTTDTTTTTTGTDTTTTDTTTDTGGTGGSGGVCTPAVTIHKKATNLREDLLDLTRAPGGYAIAKGRRFAFEVSLANTAPCAAVVTVTDLLPAGFSVTDIDPGGQVTRTQEGLRTRLAFTATVPSGPADGASWVYLRVEGVATSFGDLVNQASAGTKTSNTVTVHVTPEPAIGGLEASAKEMSGTAATGSPPTRVVGPSVWRLKRVEVAIRRLGGKNCTWVTALGRKIRFVKKVLGKCVPTAFMKAKGTSRWVLRLSRRLPPGRYVIYARAVNRSGTSNNRFSARRGNRLALTVRGA